MMEMQNAAREGAVKQLARQEQEGAARHEAAREQARREQAEAAAEMARQQQGMLAAELDRQRQEAMQQQRAAEERANARAAEYVSSGSQPASYHRASTLPIMKAYRGSRV